MNEITIPKKLEPIVRAFYSDSPEAAKVLIIQAVKAVYGSDENDNKPFTFRKKHTITEEELEGVCALIQGIKPQDTLEALIAAQIVASHLLGLRKLTKGYSEDRRIGLNMLRFSSEAISQLQKKRSGNMQNITVNYNCNGKGSTLIQTTVTSPDKPM